MNKESYRRMTDGLRARPKLKRAVIKANEGITNAIYIAYPLLVMVYCSGAAMSQKWRLYDDFDGALPAIARLILVPAISFALVSLLRRLINAPRPYEVYYLPPVIPKETRGLSFPSRHAFSIFVIGMAFCAYCPLIWVGVLILVLGVALSVLRVVGGVHFPRDVIAGAALGILCGYIGFWVI